MPTDAYLVFIFIRMQFTDAFTARYSYVCTMVYYSLLTLCSYYWSVESSQPILAVRWLGSTDGKPMPGPRTLECAVLVDHW